MAERDYYKHRLSQALKILGRSEMLHLWDAGRSLGDEDWMTKALESEFSSDIHNIYNKLLLSWSLQVE